jgi:hypothetical protein
MLNAKLAWLPDVLHASGLSVEIEPEFLTAGQGDFIEPRGIILHHTACSAPGPMPDLQVLEHGRPDLKGTLCNLGLGRDGKYRAISANLAWHAGEGMFRGIGRYKDRKTGQHVGTMDGNAYFIGIEMENNGTTEAWSSTILKAAHTGVVALLRQIGADPSWCIGHKEFCYPKNRKIDPDFPMDSFRFALAPYFPASPPVA